jgi:hypothetical protein
VSYRPYRPPAYVRAPSVGPESGWGRDIRGPTSYLLTGPLEPAYSCFLRVLRVFGCGEFLCVVAERLDRTFGFALGHAQ